MTAASDEARLVTTETPADGVTCVRLDRYARRNAMDWDMWEQLRDAVGQVRDDDSCRVMILTGTQDAFSAGADLRSPGKRGEGVGAAAARLGVAGHVLREITELRKPTVAAVDGVAIGIGWSLALACDVIMASSAARFRCAFLGNGLVPDGGMLWSLTHAVGMPRAAEIVYSDRYLGADEAAALGLVSRDTGASPALGEAIAFARQLAMASPDALALSAELLRAATSQSRSEYLRTEWVTAALNFHSEHAFSKAPHAGR